MVALVGARHRRARINGISVFISFGGLFAAFFDCTKKAAERNAREIELHFLKVKLGFRI